MKLSRRKSRNEPTVGFETEHGFLPVELVERGWRKDTGNSVEFPRRELLPLLPGGSYHRHASVLFEWLQKSPHAASFAVKECPVLLPIEYPNKLLCLAGNYAEHVIERGGTVAERTETFPWVFMKPPSTTMIPHERPVVIPANAPDGVDWELELGIVIGKRCRNVAEADALSVVAGYTIINDISQRQFKPNPQRKKRERDVFFDWLHGKWFDTFCPCGPCIVSADAVPDPQALKLKLTVNGEVKQDGSTGQMIFPVAAIIAFVSTFVTLEPGDIISTGTPKGVGSATGTFLKAGDVIEGTIDGIGTLRNPVVAEDVT